MDRIATLNEILTENPKDAFARYGLAMEYSKQGDFDRALAEFSILLENHPDYTGTYYHLGKLYEALGRKDDAISTYETGMSITKEKRENHAYAELQAVYDELVFE